MRHAFQIMLLASIGLISYQPLRAESPSCGCEQKTASGACGEKCGCDSSMTGCHSCRRCGHHKKYIEGLDRGFNCGCNGSYNYPVPPLYTYHWPGMFSQKRMTDYHSPYRFPAIKPYRDETNFPEAANQELPSFLQPVTHTVSDLPVKKAGEPESMSAKFGKLAR